MTACTDRIPLLNALVDGELDAANAAALDQHVAACADCAAALASLRALRRRIADADDLRDTAPAALRAAIEARFAAGPTPAPAPSLPARSSRRAWMGGALGGAVAASLAFALVLPMAGERATEDEIVASHVRSLLPGRLIDVATSDRHVVKPWFNGRIDFAPPVVDLKAQGFPLVGGRIDYLDGRNVAVLAYRRDRHVINLMIAPARSRWFAGGEGMDERAGYHILRWRQGDLEYSAISDVEPAALTGFREAFVAATR